VNLKIISGGQSGADIGGLRAAKDRGIETGGCAAKGFMTENGVCTDLKTIYGLIDKKYDYVARTKENVRNADITLIFADDIKSAGTRLTIESCRSEKKPYWINPAAYVVANVIIQMSRILTPDVVFVINVAGNRESVAPGVCARTESVMSSALKMWNYRNVKTKV
jgi:hypothetical protein